MQHAEKQLTKALPKMAKAAESEELREAFQHHLQQTQNQLTRLDEVFRSLNESPRRKACKAMEGLIEEAEEIMGEHEGGPEVDAALISAAQKVEHYEIASYGCLCTWAEHMGHRQAHKLLQETLAEEKDTDVKLTKLAEGLANREALAAAA